MRTTSSPLGFASWLLPALLLWACSALQPARADMLLAARSISLPGVRLQDVSLRLAPGASGGIGLQLRAAQADVPAAGWRKLGLVIQGQLQRDAALHWVFDGGAQLAGAPGGAISNARLNMQLSEAANTLLVNILQGTAHASAAMPLDQPSHAQISLKNFPVNWLQGLLGTVWSGRLGGGKLNAELALDVRASGVHSSGEFTLAGGAFDTPAGTLAAQGLAASGRFTLDSTRSPTNLDLDASLRGGQLLLGPIFARLPGHAVQLGLHAELQHGAVALSRLRITDPDALQLDGSLAFDAKSNLRQLTLDRLHASFPAAYRRYGAAWLGTLGLAGLTTAGELSAAIDLRADGLRSFSFHTDGLDLASGAGQFAVSKLRGGLDWALRGERPATTLGWRRLQVYRVPNGAAEAHWQSRDGALMLQQPLVIPLLKGQLRVASLDWRPADAKGQRLTTSLALSGGDMAAFSQAMGWPAFPGTLAGAVPSLRWVDDRLDLQGGLSANVFGGFADFTQLSLQQPFGPSPVLSGDLSLRQLDLGAITSVFDFGSISGRLDGSVQGLRLVGWSPVAFQARLLAGDGGRISQRAVNNLTSVGGGGVAAGLQGVVLKWFKTFGYKRIGLNCTLQAAVCQMSGLDADADGYTIVEGSGLPRLRVIGHQTRVDWPTLVSRLLEAIHGAAPVVR